MEPKYTEEELVQKASIALEKEDYPRYFSLIAEGLFYYSKSYELYLMLGQYYAWKNANQAYLCFENALFYCGIPEDRAIIQEFIEALKKEHCLTVEKMSIVILSYNNQKITKECLESIRRNNSEHTYELIVVDNASTDGACQWLKEQKDICLISNAENKGFPYGCNQGIAEAEAGNAILLLNNDTIVMPNALFWLRMGLYETDRTGAAGCVSNNAVNYQQVEETFENIEEWMDFAQQNNIPMEQPYEKKGWLMGFAVLLKRSALEQTLAKGDGGNQQRKGEIKEYLDTRFSPGNYEDNDLCIRLLLAGYELRLCKNSFIFHYGSKAFDRKRKSFTELLIRNEQKLALKYGINFIPYSYVEKALVDMVKPKEPCFSILEAGCRLGATLARIESIYPEAQIQGIERNSTLASLAAMVARVWRGDFLESIWDERYDYVILDQILHLGSNSAAMLTKASDCLSPHGAILICVKNRQCISSQKEDGGFLLEEILELFQRTSLSVKSVSYRSARLRVEEENRVTRLCSGENKQNRKLYEAEKFIFEVVKFRG